jgi:hypothetical protein
MVASHNLKNLEGIDQRLLDKLEGAGVQSVSGPSHKYRLRTFRRILL